MVDVVQLREYLMKHEHDWHSAAELAAAIGYDGPHSQIEAALRTLVVEVRDELYAGAIRSSGPLVVETADPEPYFHVLAAMSPIDWQMLHGSEVDRAVRSSGGARGEYLDRAAASLAKLRTALLGG